MTVSGKLCCVALPFCCVVVVALPFSASLGVIVHVHVLDIPKPLQFGVKGEREGVRGGQLLPLLDIQHPYLQLEHILCTLWERGGGREGGGRGGRGRGGRGEEGGEGEIMETHVQQILVPLQGAS